MEGHETLYVFGDLAYTAAFGTACPFEHPLGRFALQEDERPWNSALSSVRIEVERSFGRVQTTWTYTAFGKGLRMLSPKYPQHGGNLLLRFGQTRRSSYEQRLVLPKERKTAKPALPLPQP